jgi:catechol 2,3-dioxygenase-like lactoylglutathione lyase family enzyme
MPRIVHIAIKVDDLEKATKFYEEVFGFHQSSTGYARGYVSRHLTDGNIDLALMVLRGPRETPRREPQSPQVTGCLEIR